MFKQFFEDVLSNLTADKVLTDDLFEEIHFKYSSASRYYHNVGHLDHLTRELNPVKNQIEDWQIIILSVAYHDIVYNPLKKDNEERSASIAVDRLSKLNLKEDQKEKCRQQILSTKTHAASDNPDTNYFTDADLSILGSVAESYLEYSCQVRKEYKYFPDFIYKPGRQKVLHHFLEMPRIYKTDYFYQHFELQARANLKNELKELS